MAGLVIMAEQKSAYKFNLTHKLNIIFNENNRTERAVSPSDSVVSVTSHMPPPSTSRGGNNNTYRSNASSSGGTKRQRGAVANNNRNPTPFVSDHTHDQIPGSRRGAASDSYNILPSTAHPSLPPPYGNANSSGHVSSTYDIHGISHTHGISDALDWGIPRTQQLEGPGMPVARSASLHSQAASAPALHSAAAADPTDAGDGDGDGDDRTYCICDRVSYGEMIACDDSQCEREWVCFLFLSDNLFFTDAFPPSVDSSILLVLA